MMYTCTRIPASQSIIEKYRSWFFTFLHANFKGWQIYEEIPIDCRVYRVQSTPLFTSADYCHPQHTPLLSVVCQLITRSLILTILVTS
jgi:hypothetical protein